MSAITAVPIRPLAKGSVLKLWLALALLCAAGAGLAWWATAPLQRERLSDDIRYQVVEAGEGPTATSQDLVQYHFTIFRADGTMVFSSRLQGQPQVGTLNAGPLPVINQGLGLMRNGSRYRFWAPARAAFAEPPPASENISPEELMSFDIEVLGILPGMAAMQMGMPGAGGAPGATPGAPGALPGPPGADPHAGLPPEMGAPEGPPPGPPTP